MYDPLVLKIITPKTSYEEEADMVLLPSFDGEVGIMPNHIPLILKLQTGIVKVIFESKEKRYFIYNGIVEVTAHYANILTDFVIDISDETKKDIFNEVKKLELSIVKNPHSKDLSIINSLLTHYRAFLDYTS